MLSRRRFLGLAGAAVTLRPWHGARPEKPPVRTVTETPRSLLIGDERLGTDDDGPVLSACLARLAERSNATGGPVVLDLDGLRYNCATAVRADNVHGEVTVANGTLFRTSKYGPFAPELARNNAHLILRGNGTAHVEDVAIRGTNTNGVRSGTYVVPTTGERIRDHLEQQAGVWALTEHFSARAVDIAQVWGDYISLGARGSGTELRQMQTALVIPGVWQRNGRVGLLAHAAETTFLGGSDPTTSVIRSCRSTTYHVESSQNPRGFMRRHRVENLFQSSGSSRFIHWSGGSAIDTLRVANNRRSGWPVNVFIAGERHADGSPKIKAVTITGNAWDAPQTGDYFVKIANVGAVTFTGNEGPLRDTWPVDQQVLISGATTVVKDLSGLFLAP
jgi:hypothetical protein